MLEKLRNEVQLYKLHVKHYHMSPAQFRRRTSMLGMPGEIYDKYDRVVKSCKVCSTSVPSPPRARIAGLRASSLGDLIFADHAEIKFGTSLYLVLLIIDGATNLSIDEVEQQQTRRRMEANETVEVDMRVNTAKVHVEQQETLLRQTSSNPWFLFNHDVLALKDAMGNKVYSDYGDARARVVAWRRDMPVRLRALLGDIGPAKWLQHPLAVATVYTSFCELLSLAKCRGTS